MNQVILFMTLTIHRFLITSFFLFKSICLSINEDEGIEDHSQMGKKNLDDICLNVCWCKKDSLECRKKNTLSSLPILNISLHLLSIKEM